MQRGLPELIQHSALDHCQINQRGVTEVQVGTRELLEVFTVHHRLGCVRTKAHLELHAGNRSKMDVRVNEAWNKKLSLSGNDGCTGRLLCPFSPLDADNASVLDQHITLSDVIEILRRDDSDVSDPDSARRLVRS